ncbi:hypothetical protein MNBD_NITROSPINAE02-1294, partial [hydrothermal vent metagenome]
MFIRNQYFQAALLAVTSALLFPAPSPALDIPPLTGM